MPKTLAFGTEPRIILPTAEKLTRGHDLVLAYDICTSSTVSAIAVIWITTGIKDCNHIRYAFGMKTKWCLDADVFTLSLFN